MDSTMLGLMSKEELIAFALRVQEHNIAVTSENIAVKSEVVALNAKVEDLMSSNLQISHQLEVLRKLHFGSKSERFVPGDPNQLVLDLGLSIEVAKKDAEKENTAVSREKRVRKARPVRLPLPESLPRNVIWIEPGVDTTGMTYLRDEVTEELEYVPAYFIVNQFRRKVYLAVGTDEKTSFFCGNLPSRPIAKGIAGPGLIAWIIVEKFLWHIPFYRQSQRLASKGFKIPDSTMGDWFAQSAKLLELLWDELRKRTVESGYVQSDDTPINVLASEKKGSAHKGFYWIYRAVMLKIVLFDYQPGRGMAGPVRMLLKFQGWLQTDGYAAYDNFEQRSGIFLVGCLAHARRYFDRALDNDKERATWMLGKIGDLYGIEREAREEKMTHEQRKELRQKKSLPILKEIGEWLQENCTKVTPKSAIGIAINYFMGRYKYICRVAEDGQLEIDNNLAENAIRPIAIGRKNYMFAGSHDAARNAAIIYSLLGTAKANGIDPQAWLTDVLTRIQDHPINRISELLPLENEYKPVPAPLAAVK